MILHLLLFSFFNLATSSEFCFDSSCIGDSQTIRFPFWIANGQPKSCGYPGFDLSCHATGKPLLHLPPSGDFNVQNIDYKNQEIKINDPYNCLPKRFSPSIFLDHRSLRKTLKILLSLIVHPIICRIGILIQFIA